MSEIDETIYSEIDNSLNNYETNIESVGTALDTNNYDGKIAEAIETANVSKENISEFLQNLTFSAMNTNDDITKMDTSYNAFYDDLQESNATNDRLHKLVAKYQVTEAQIKNAQKTNTYYGLLVWIIIFMFVAAALFLSIIEDKKDLNIFSKTLLFLFSLVVFFYIAQNLWFYIERNIQ